MKNSEGKFHRIRVMLWLFSYYSLFRYSFRNLYKWRRFVLVRFGAKIDSNVRFKRTVRVECPWNLRVGTNTYFGDDVFIYNLGMMVFKENITVSQRTFFCDGTHDYKKKSFDLIVKPITVESDVWIAADVFVGPGVKIGNGCVVGAKSVVIKDLQAGMVCAGHPCKTIKQRYQ